MTQAEPLIKLVFPEGSPMRGNPAAVAWLNECNKVLAAHDFDGKVTARLLGGMALGAVIHDPS